MDSTDKNQKNSWELRPERKICGDISNRNRSSNIHLITLRSSTKLKNKAAYTLCRYKTRKTNETEVPDLLKQKLAVTANKTQTNLKLFYRNLNKEEPHHRKRTEVPPEGVLKFWKSIWAIEKTHEFNTKWIKEEIYKVDKTQNSV